MKRGSLIGTAVVAALLLALPAVGQPYGGGPPEDPPFSVAEEQGQVITSTPCSTVYVTGSNWGPGTTIAIDREFSDPDCPGVDVPEPDDVTRTLTNPAAPRSSGESSGSAPREQGQSQGKAHTADESGRFAIPVQVPADQADSFSVTVTGTDESGASRSEVQEFDIVQAASFVPDATIDDGRTLPAAAAALALVIIALAFGWPTRLMRRVFRRP